MMKTTTTWILVAAVLGFGLIGCGDKGTTTEGTAGTAGSTPAAGSGSKGGELTIDGSSTVYPLSQAIGEELRKTNSDLKLTVSESGTGGGFKKFIAKEIDIAGASRPIDEKELEGAKTAGVEFIELPIAYDGLTVVVNKENTWAKSLTVTELKAIWSPDSKILNWKDVRAGFPDQALKLYGAGTASGTFDYFTEAICGKKGAIRKDYQGSEDDNVTVQGVTGDKGAMGFFGYTYFLENKETLNAVEIDNGAGPVAPNEETIIAGKYAPLARPLFIYVNKASAERKEIQDYVKFFLSEQGVAILKEEKYVALPAKAYELANKRFEDRKTGSVFGGKSAVGEKIEDLLAKEG